jgi:hypothetical protein
MRRASTTAMPGGEASVHIVALGANGEKVVQSKVSKQWAVIIGEPIDLTFREAKTISGTLFPRFERSPRRSHDLGALGPIVFLICLFFFTRGDLNGTWLLGSPKADLFQEINEKCDEEENQRAQKAALDSSATKARGAPVIELEGQYPPKLPEISERRSSKDGSHPTTVEVEKTNAQVKVNQAVRLSNNQLTNVLDLDGLLDRLSMPGTTLRWLDLSFNQFTVIDEVLNVLFFCAWFPGLIQFASWLRSLIFCRDSPRAPV